MTIDGIVSHLLSTYVPHDGTDWGAGPHVDITDRNLQEWSEATNLPRPTLYDAIALRLAVGFHNNSLAFGFCDAVANDLHGVISRRNEDPPELFWNVFLAFDAGEFYPRGDRSIDPVQTFTRPQIAEIVRKYVSN